MIFLLSGLLVYVPSMVHGGSHFDLSLQACRIWFSNRCHSDCVKSCLVICITRISIEIAPS